MASNQELYNDLAYYTLAHKAPSFIHQLVVDAYTAQNADAETKPIAVAFALIGISLHTEKGYTGKQVQQAHMRLAARRKDWPRMALPKTRGAITIAELLAVPPGSQRDEAIERWCRAVWESYSELHEEVRKLVNENLY